MLRIFVLGITQSLAEFLPVSSSAHLVLLPLFCGWEDQGMLTDVALHVGTLFSVVLYFRKDVAALTRGAFSLLKGRTGEADARFLLLLIVATLPVLAVGFFAGGVVDAYLRSPRLIACTMSVFGVALYFADRYGPKKLTVGEMTFGRALFVGAAQVLAIVPGVSRSGITVTAARLAGVKREDAARFSMLLSIPTIGAAGGYGLLRFLSDPSVAEEGRLVLFGMFVSFAGGLAAVWFLMNWVKKASFAVFAVYRILLGAVLFYLF